MRSGEHDAHARMETATTKVDDGEYFNNEPNVSYPLRAPNGPQKEEPMMVLPMSGVAHELVMLPMVP